MIRTPYEAQCAKFKNAREKYEWEEAWLDNARREIASKGYDDPIMAWACYLNYARQHGEISERMENAPYRKKIAKRPRVTVIDRYGENRKPESEWKLKKYGASVYTTT